MLRNTYQYLDAVVIFTTITAVACESKKVSVS